MIDKDTNGRAQSQKHSGVSLEFNSTSRRSGLRSRRLPGGRVDRIRALPRVLERLLDVLALGELAAMLGKSIDHVEARRHKCGRQNALRMNAEPPGRHARSPSRLHGDVNVRYAVLVLVELGAKCHCVLHTCMIFHGVFNVLQIDAQALLYLVLVRSLANDLLLLHDLLLRRSLLHHRARDSRHGRNRLCCPLRGFSCLHGKPGGSLRIVLRLHS
mmetsp:Transcript_10673/g.28517  ORF Transcript_10673/g.28517 Transcript_10673/m.28517 type:complete len:215 (-) Transcript_10673:2252-2896(-)